MLKQACACRASVYTSLCLVISHSVFVLMSSVINSPLVGLLICIFTYLHCLLVVVAFLHQRQERPPAVAHPLMSFSAPSPHLLRCEPALFRLEPTSVAPPPPLDALGGAQGGRGGGNKTRPVCLRKNQSLHGDGGRGGRLLAVPCDLQRSGGYFHHASTAPHWPRNGATHPLDWLPRLKTPLGS